LKLIKLTQILTVSHSKVFQVNSICHSRLF